MWSLSWRTPGLHGTREHLSCLKTTIGKLVDIVENIFSSFSIMSHHRKRKEEKGEKKGEEILHL